MNKLTMLFTMLVIVICIFFVIGCDENTKCPVCPAASNGPVYWVSVTVTNPQGQPQGGAVVTLANLPTTAGTYVDTTDNNGRAVIQAPEGQQQVLVTMGTVMQGTLTINVTASSTTTQTNPQTTGTVQLTQNTATGKKVLIVSASAEELEVVLRTIGFTTFDSTDIYSLRDQANVDSNAVYNYVRQYSIIFSDCDGGSEGSSNYAALSRVYGRYVAQGGKIYGGHYNYYHMQRIFPPKYQTSTYGGADEMTIINTSLSAAVGFTVASFPGDLQYYDYWTDLPVNSTVYSVISGTTGSASSPSGIPVIVENRVGTGKYLWTSYHNQDINDDPQLIKIVQYFLLSL